MGIWVRYVLRERGQLFAALSILFHLLLFLIPEGNKSPPASPEKYQEIFSFSEEGKAKNETYKVGSPNGQKKVSGKNLSLSRKGSRIGIYSVDPDALLFSDTSTKALELGTPLSYSDGKGGRWAVPLDSLKYTGVLSQIYELLDNSITYPLEFVENHIEGRVAAVLYFDSDGKYIREKSKFSGYSNYVNVWFKKHTRRLFGDGLPFPVGKVPIKVSINLEFELGQREKPGLKQMISGGKIYIYRQSAKNIGIKLVELKSPFPKVPLVAVDILGFIDRMKRVLDLSNEKEHERNLLDILREDREWGRD